MTNGGDGAKEKDLNQTKERFILLNLRAASEYFGEIKRTQMCAV